MTTNEKMAYERALWAQFLAAGGDPLVATKEWFE